MVKIYFYVFIIIIHSFIMLASFDNKNNKWQITNNDSKISNSKYHDRTKMIKLIKINIK